VAQLPVEMTEEAEVNCGELYGDLQQAAVHLEDAHNKAAQALADLIHFRAYDLADAKAEYDRAVAAASSVAMFEAGVVTGKNAEQRSIQLQRYLDTDDNVIGAKIEVAHDERIVANLEGDVEVAKAKVAGARARFRALTCELDMRRALVEAGAELEQAI